MTQTDNQSHDVLDRIDRQIDIDATAEKVYALVSQPGWWINDQQIDPEQERRVEGDVTVVVHPEYGEFRLLTLEEDPPRHVAFTWIDNVSVDVGTRVEFQIVDRAEGGVTLKVSETGFASLKKDRDQIVNHVKDNTHGWEVELDLARQFVTGRTP